MSYYNNNFKNPFDVNQNEKTNSLENKQKNQEKYYNNNFENPFENTNKKIIS